ncbi:UNKNOWN [Stylonychia lemnae]|uniref:Uncharacterized protein n=1 Tax=Stylonychia lemnae TaxID=5949 RepID=A0A077ZTQ4_STYLE|nr:UNKNOWN [Stylonychia lemnae]|eukprot:CDW72914.1 UNKNOWN [Stylonychia lemnae]
MYSPLMANIKFLGGLSAFIVTVANRSNYFNQIYFASNYLLEALISSGPLIIIQSLCVIEFDFEREYYIQSLFFSVLCFVVNFAFGIYMLADGIKVDVVTSKHLKLKQIE